MNWNDPAERLALIERIGAEAYNEEFEEHMRQTTLVTICGHAIREVGSRFGRLFQVGSTGRAFKTILQAETYACENPVGEPPINKSEQ